jgi:hypothetical protein
MNANADTVMPTGTESSLGDDLLKGVSQIAVFIDESERRTYYLLERGYLPAGKMGATWIASKRALRAQYARITQNAA